MAAGSADADDVIDALLSVDAQLGRAAAAVAPRRRHSVPSAATSSRVYMSEIVAESAARGDVRYDLLVAHHNALLRGDSGDVLPPLSDESFPPDDGPWHEVPSLSEGPLYGGLLRSRGRVSAVGAIRAPHRAQERRAGAVSTGVVGGDAEYGAAGLGDDGDNAAVSDDGSVAAAPGASAAAPVAARAPPPVTQPTGLGAQQRLRNVRVGVTGAPRLPRSRSAGAAASAPRRRASRSSETQQGMMERWERVREAYYVAALMRLGAEAAGEAKPPPRWQPTRSHAAHAADAAPGTKRARVATSDASATHACAGGVSCGGDSGGTPAAPPAAAVAAAAASTPATGACTGCGDAAPRGFVVLCRDCGVLCARCDAAAHADERALTHRRCMHGGVTLHPGVFVHPVTGCLYEHGLHVDYRPWMRCPCGALCWQQTYERSPGDAPDVAEAPVARGYRLLGATLAGVVLLIVPLRVHCGSCGGDSVDHCGNPVPLSRARPVDYLDVMHGWWPQSPSQTSVVLSVQMLDVVAACRRERNNLGDEALQGVLTRLASVLSGDRWTGGRDHADPMRRVSWTVAVAERLQLLFELDVLRQATDAHTCAVCGVTPELLALDVIKKLGRRPVPGAGDDFAYDFAIFLPTAETDAHEANFPPECDRGGGKAMAAGAAAVAVAGCDNVRAGRTSHGAGGKSKLAMHGVAGYGCPHLLLALYALAREETYVTKHVGASHVAAVLQARFQLGDNVCAEQHLAAARAAADAAAVLAAHDAADASATADADAAAASRDSAAMADARDHAHEHARGIALHAASAAESVVRRQQGSAAAAAFRDRALAAISARPGAPVARLPVGAQAIAAAPLVAVTAVAPSGAVAAAFAVGAGGEPLASPAAASVSAPAATTVHHAAPDDVPPLRALPAAASRGARGAGRRTARRDVPYLCPCVGRGHHARAAPVPADPAQYSTPVDGRVNARTPYLHGAFHSVECQLRYSILYTPGTGWCDGEFVERKWARLYAMGRLVRGCSPAVWRQFISYAVLVINEDANRRAHEIALQQLRAALKRANRLTAEFEAEWRAACSVTAPGVCILSSQERETVARDGVDALAADWLTELRRWLCGGGAAEAAQAAAGDDAALLALHEATGNVGTVAHAVAVNAFRRSPAFAAVHTAVLAASPVPTEADDRRRLALARRRLAEADSAVTRRGHATRARYNAGEAPFIKPDSVVRVNVQVLGLLVAEYALRGAAIGDADSSKARSKARFGRESTATLSSRINERLQQLRTSLRSASPALKAVGAYVPHGTMITVDELSVIDAATRRGSHGGPAPHVLAARYSLVRAHARSRRAIEEIRLVAGRLLAILRSRVARRDACRAALDTLCDDVRVVAEAICASGGGAGGGGSRSAADGAAGAAPPRPAALTLGSDADGGGLPPSTRALLHPRAPIAPGPHEAPPGAAPPRRYASTARAVAEAYGLRHALCFLRGRAAAHASGARDADELVESARHAIRDARDALRLASGGARAPETVAPASAAAATVPSFAPVSGAAAYAAETTARAAAEAAAHLDLSVGAADGGWEEWLLGGAPTRGLPLAPDPHFVAVLDAVSAALDAPRSESRERGCDSDGDTTTAVAASGMAADGDGSANDDCDRADDDGDTDCDRANSDGDDTDATPAAGEPVIGAAAAARLDEALGDFCGDFAGDAAAADCDSDDGDGEDLDAAIAALDNPHALLMTIDGDSEDGLDDDGADDAGRADGGTGLSGARNDGDDGYRAPTECAGDAAARPRPGAGELVPGPSPRPRLDSATGDADGDVQFDVAY